METIDLLGDSDLERLGRGLLLMVPLVSSCDPKAWQREVKGTVAAELRKIGQSLVKLSVTHQIVEKPGMKHSATPLATVERVRSALPDVELKPLCRACKEPVFSPSDATVSEGGGGYVHWGCSR